MVPRILAVVVIGLGVRSVPPMEKEDFSHLNTIERVVYRESKINKLDPYFADATFVNESQYNGNATNKRTGATGCGQLTPETMKKLGLDKKRAKDCKTSIEYSTYWMSILREELKAIDPKNAHKEKNLSEFYYCGANYYGKIIYDKDYKKRERCGDSYSKGVMKKMQERKSKGIFAKLEKEFKNEKV